VESERRSEAAHSALPLSVSEKGGVQQQAARQASRKQRGKAAAAQQGSCWGIAAAKSGLPPLAWCWAGMRCMCAGSGYATQHRAHVRAGWGAKAGTVAAASPAGMAAAAVRGAPVAANMVLGEARPRAAAGVPEARVEAGGMEGGWPAAAATVARATAARAAGATAARAAVERGWMAGA
jgi:hypothetical protein